MARVLVAEHNVDFAAPILRELDGLVGQENVDYHTDFIVARDMPLATYDALIVNVGLPRNRGHRGEGSGLMLAQMSRQAGIEHVFVTGSIPEELARAREDGFDKLYTTNLAIIELLKELGIKDWRQMPSDLKEALGIK
jgi:hypothetical protein